MSRKLGEVQSHLIEAWGPPFKHHWLYLHQNDSLAALRRLVGFYVRQHNEVMPHWAVNGLTPDEVYFGPIEGVVETLDAGRVVPRPEQLSANQAESCPIWPRSPPEFELL